jgi:hypothetical protein
MKPATSYDVSASIRRSIQRGFELLAADNPKRYAQYVQKPKAERTDEGLRVKK